MKTKTIYIADDGYEFHNQEECKEWEKTISLREHLESAGYSFSHQKRITDIILANFILAEKLKIQDGKVLNQSNDNR